jgi:DnaK suppressor protein
MDEERARRLLESERTRVEALLAEQQEAARSDRASEDAADAFDDAPEELVDQLTADAVSASLRSRLAAIARAEARLADGTYGRSVRSGRPIPDDRLEADPAAELTADEAGS